MRPPDRIDPAAPAFFRGVPYTWTKIRILEGPMPAADHYVKSEGNIPCPGSGSCSLCDGGNRKREVWLFKVAILSRHSVDLYGDSRDEDVGGHAVLRFGVKSGDKYDSLMRIDDEHGFDNVDLRVSCTCLKFQSLHFRPVARDERVAVDPAGDFDLAGIGYAERTGGPT